MAQTVNYEWCRKLCKHYPNCHIEDTNEIEFCIQEHKNDYYNYGHSGTDPDSMEAYYNSINLLNKNLIEALGNEGHE